MLRTLAHRLGCKLPPAMPRWHGVRLASNAAATSAPAPKECTLIPGDGIGPEIVEATVEAVEATGAPIRWIVHEMHGRDPLSDKIVESARRTGVVLKGPVSTLPSDERQPINTSLDFRRKLGLHTARAHAESLPGLRTRHDGINMVIVRENLEGEYSGLEHEVVPGVMESLKIITRDESLRAASTAFAFARDEGRRRITAVHKANIMKKTDGLFLECCREVAAQYPDLRYDEVIIDACCMQLVMRPQTFDVLVTPNLYGNIVTSVVAGLVGGPGVVSAVHCGPNIHVFEAAMRNLGLDIAHRGRANPTALMLAGARLLRQLGLQEPSQRLDAAVRRVIADGKIRTPDIGGTASTREFTRAVIDAL